MVAIVQATLEAFIDAGTNAANTTAQGRALEDLICYVFGLVPGIAITHRNEMNVFATEEILALGDTDALAHLIKQKLCDLAVKGAIA